MFPKVVKKIPGNYYWLIALVVKGVIICHLANILILLPGTFDENNNECQKQY
jgi:hypothetical protein